MSDTVPGFNGFLVRRRQGALVWLPAIVPIFVAVGLKSCATAPLLIARRLWGVARGALVDLPAVGAPFVANLAAIKLENPVVSILACVCRSWRVLVVAHWWAFLQLVLCLWHTWRTRTGIDSLRSAQQVGARCVCVALPEQVVHMGSLCAWL